MNLQLNWLDWTLAVIAAAYVIEGLVQGFSRVAVGLAATVAGVILGLYMYGVAGSVYAPYVKSAGVANVLGFFTVFVAVQVLGALAGWALAKLFKWTGLGWMDRMLGVGVGALKGALVAVVVVMVITAFPMNPVPESVAGSQVAPYAAEAGEVIAQMAPYELKGGFAETYGRLKEYWNARPPKRVKPLDRAQF